MNEEEMVESREDFVENFEGDNAIDGGNRGMV